MDFNAGMKRKFLRGISWVLLLILLSNSTIFSIENVFDTNLSTTYAQEIQEDTSLLQEEVSTEDEIPTEEVSEVPSEEGTFSEEEEISPEEETISIEEEKISSEEELLEEEQEDISEKEEPEQVISDMMLFGSPMMPFGIRNDVTAFLNPTFELLQGGVVLGDSDKIDSTKDLQVRIVFPVPVAGDPSDPVDYVEKGDYADFVISGKFAVLGSSTLELKNGDELVGHITISEGTDPVNPDVIAHVEFDQDILDDPGTSNVECTFVANLRYDGEYDYSNPGNHLVTILGRTYEIIVPAPPIEYEVTKNYDASSVKDGIIKWTVEIGADQNGNPDPIDLSGYKFVDNLHSANIGDYITGTFEIGGSSVTPALDPVSGGNELSYEFPSGTVAPVEVTFETKIPEGKYYGSGGQSITNKAELKDSSDQLLEDGSSTVTFTPNQWIEKNGSQTAGQGNPQDGMNREITWIIEANHGGASLTNAVIKDTLPSGLTFKSATWEKWDGDAYVDSQNISPVGDEYRLNDINTKVRLIIVTTVVNDTTVTSPRTFNNSASITWDGAPGEGNNGGLKIGPIGVTVGYPVITKSGSVNPSDRTVTWTVNVETKGQAQLINLKVYDLLVYGSTGFDKATATGWPSDITGNDINDIRYNQKFDKIVSLSGSITHVVHPIFNAGGERVADLVEFTGLSTAAGEVNVISFDSLVLNPDIFASNTSGSRYIDNTAILLSDAGKFEASANPEYNSRILYKEMLHRNSVMTPAAGVNNSTTTAAQGFHYIDKSVVFRLNVNAEGIDWTNIEDGNGQELGKVIVTDTLPPGWEFVPFEGGEDYLIFEGTKNGSNGAVSATDTVPDTVSGLEPDIDGGTATFTFDPLTRPYVILVKARPNDATLKNYFDGNETNSPSNSVTFTTENWTPGVSVQRGVSVTSRILHKDRTIPSDGELKWTVEYQPYGLQVGSMIVDTLSPGMELRTDSGGNLLIDGNITADEMILQPDGSYSLGTPVSLVPGSNISYDSATRTLTFYIPDKAKAYRLTYITDLTGEANTQVFNTVQLLDSDLDFNLNPVQFDIRSADASATFQRNGYLDIIKKDGSGNVLSGAEFTLFADDGTTVIRKGTSGSDGRIRMKVIPNGNYLLRETAAPSGGYALEGIDHRVTVNTVGSVVTTSIDGKTGAGSNELEVSNFLSNTVGKLTIRKTVAGTANEGKSFEFTILFNGTAGGTSYPYSKNGIFSGTIQSGGTVSLSHGESISIPNLPAGTVYTVTEEDYSNDGYETTVMGGSGTIAADSEQSAVFTNTKNKPGSLTISKTVMGNAADFDKEFEFTITLSDNINEYDYVGANGGPTGKIRGTATVLLGDGESITISDLLEDMAYTVTEEDYSSEGYVTRQVGDTGTIETDKPKTTAFINTKNEGSLTIKKTVEGNKGDKNKKFEFTVEFTGDGGKQYSYMGTGVPDGTITSGDTIELTHDQSITITGILEGTGYRVEEKDYSSEGYVMKSTGESGIINDAVRTAHFTNTKEVREPGGGDNDNTDKDRSRTPGNRQFKINEVPDPNEKDSPSIIEVVDKDGKLIGIFKKVQNADGSYSYIDENGVVLSEAYVSLIAKTGDNMPLIPIIIVTVISAIGLVLLVLYKKRYFGYYYD